MRARRVGGGSSIASRGLEDLRNGLRTFALVAGGINLFAMSVQVTTKLVSGGEQWGAAAWAVEFVEGIVQVAFAAFLWWLARSGRAGRKALWATGASFYALLIVISTYYDTVYLNIKDPQLVPSWVCLTLLVYALLVPGPRRYHATLIGGATLAGPVAVAIAWVAGAYGTISGVMAAEAALAAAIPIAICGVVSLLVITRNIRRARSLQELSYDLERLGSYVLERKLGEGGMGDVWLARHDLLAMPAAIKRIKPSLLGDDDEEELALARFEREARATAQLTSAHTISIYDFGRTANGDFYYVMELLEGLDLVTLVERHGVLPDGRVRAILLQACDSLGEAHAAGMIHRDVKPANIMLCRQGRTLDIVKILDFGLVRTSTASTDAASASSDEPSDQDLTVPGTITGTPTYISPEQIAEHAEVDGRADLYALGCVAYYLLTGAPPFKGESAMMTLALHTTETATPPSERRGSPLSPELEAIILRLLSKDPRARYDDADALADALRACSVLEPWSEQNARDFYARHGLAGDPRVDHEDSTRADGKMPRNPDVTRPTRRKDQTRRLGDA